MLRVRQAAKFLGKSGIDFLITLLLYFLFRVTGHTVLAVLAWIALIPPGIIIVIRLLRFLQRNALWSVRNRLLFAYGLMGVLPIILLFLLVGLGTWAAINELAIYLATSELNRRLASLNGAIDAVRTLPPNYRDYAAPEIVKGFSHTFPKLSLYITDASGEHRYPPTARELHVPAEWGNTNGLLVLDHHFYGWAHYKSGNQEITALAPLSDEMIENLVPHLGAISLFEDPKEKNPSGKPLGDEAAAAGSFKETVFGTPSNPDVKFSATGPPHTTPAARVSFRCPDVVAGDVAPSPPGRAEPDVRRGDLDLLAPFGGIGQHLHRYGIPARRSV